MKAELSYDSFDSSLSLPFNFLNKTQQYNLMRFEKVIKVRKPANKTCSNEEPDPRSI